jgi:hypothetical protein
MFGPSIAIGIRIWDGKPKSSGTTPPVETYFILSEADEILETEAATPEEMVTEEAP